MGKKYAIKSQNRTNFFREEKHTPMQV